MSASVASSRKHAYGTRQHTKQHNNRARYANIAPASSGKADASGNWRKPLSVEAKPFIPPVELSPDAPAFSPSPLSSDSAREEEFKSPVPPVKIPSLKTISPSGTPKAGASTPKVFMGSTPRTPGTLKDEKYEYYNPYDVHAPREFRSAMDAIYGIPFGGSLAFLFDGQNSHTVVKSMGEGKASIQLQISEKLLVEVVSAGMNDGDFAKISINGSDYCPNQKGVNILVVDTKSLDAYVGVFDTHAHIGNESSHLTRFLNAIPETHVVLIAVRYDAARRMHPEARAALKARGVDLPLPDNANALERVVAAIDPNRGADLLSMAATVNAPKCAEVLLKNGWDVNHQKRHGSRNTPLLDAVFHGSVDVIRVLLDAEADQELQNKWQETAKAIATRLFGFHSLEELVEIVLQKNQPLAVPAVAESTKTE